jgi:hypothetical protein
MDKRRVNISIEIQTSPSSCRDRGWMGGWVGALCLSFSPYDSFWFRDANGSRLDEDRHKAPTHPPIHPLSLQVFDDQKRIPGRGTLQSVGRWVVRTRGWDPCGRPRPRSHISPFPYDEWRREAWMVGGMPTRVPAPHPPLPRPYKMWRYIFQRSWFSPGRTVL